MKNQRKKIKKNAEPTEAKGKKKNNRVAITDRIVSGGVLICFVGVLCFAMLLVAMLVFKI